MKKFTPNHLNHILNELIDNLRLNKHDYVRNPQDHS